MSGERQAVFAELDALTDELVDRYREQTAGGEGPTGPMPDRPP